MIKRVSLFKNSFCAIIALLLLACSTEEDYKSPLNDITIGDVSFDYAADSYLLDVKDVHINDCVFSVSEPWCSVSVMKSSLLIKCEENNTIQERNAIVSITDPRDNTSLSFRVIQKLNTSLLNKIQSFELVSKSGKEYKSFLITDCVIHVVVSPKESLDKMRVRIANTGKKCLVDGEESWEQKYYDFSDFTKPHSVSLISEKGDIYKWEITVYDLPVITIVTPDSLPILSKTERKEGCALCLINQDGSVDSLGTAGIKGRGNSSWLEPKKPYNVKLDKKSAILGMNKSKHWILLANTKYDRSQLHNDVAFKIASLTDFSWCQQGEFVELILNGQHKGLYYLCEKIRIESGKIDISEMMPTDTIGDALTGGYLLEGVIEETGDMIFQTDYFNHTGADFQYNLSWEISEPEGNVPNAQKIYIKNKLNQLEGLITNESTLFSGEYRDLLDIESAINWWLVENLCVNEESSRTKNMILYKDRDSSPSGGKFTVGPPWDFDAWSFEMGGGKWLPCSTAWCYSGLLKDPFILKRIKEKWAEYYDTWKSIIPDYIDSQAAKIRKSALRNELLWPDWPFSQYNFEQHAVLMREAFSAQLEWMNSYVQNL